MPERHERMASLVKDVLSSIIQRYYPINNGIISITQVKMDRRLTTAQVFISIYKPIPSKEVIFNNLIKNTPKLRHELTKILKDRFRRSPQLFFKMDGVIAKNTHMESLFQKVRQIEQEK